MSYWQKVVSLFDNTILVFVLAGFGLLCFLCSGLGFWQLSQPQPALVSMTVPKLESLSKLPKATSLEVRDGYLFWAGAKESVAFLKSFGVKVKNSENVEAVYVPLLSKAAFIDWQNLLAKGERAATLPYHQCRIVVEFRPWEMEAQLAAAAADVRDGQPPGRDDEARHTFYGSIRRMADEDKAFVEGMNKRDSGYDVRKTLILTPRERSDPEIDLLVNRLISLGFGVAGLLSLVLFGVWAFRRWRKPKAENPSFPLPSAETSSLKNPEENAG